MVRIFKKNGKTKYDISKEAKETLIWIGKVEKKQKSLDKRLTSLKKRLKKN